MTQSKTLEPRIAAAACVRPAEEHAGRVVRLQLVTIGWMIVESGVSLAGAKSAHSPALLAFGSDSLVELLSACVVILQVRTRIALSRERAARIAGGLLLVLAAIVVLTSTLSLVTHAEPGTSVAGMGITLGALVVMPLLAAKKRGLARLRNDAALAADAVQSATCAYLAALTLVGLAASGWLHLRWIDPVAGLAAVPFLLVEGRRAMRGQPCSCC